MHGRATTLGKLFTPSCLDADTLRYYMQSSLQVTAEYWVTSAFSETRVSNIETESFWSVT